jgi:hypothetical protein
MEAAAAAPKADKTTPQPPSGPAPARTAQKAGTASSAATSTESAAAFRRSLNRAGTTEPPQVAPPKAAEPDKKAGFDPIGAIGHAADAFAGTVDKAAQTGLDAAGKVAGAVGGEIGKVTAPAIDTVSKAAGSVAGEIGRIAAPGLYAIDKAISPGIDAIGKYAKPVLNAGGRAADAGLKIYDQYKDGIRDAMDTASNGIDTAVSWTGGQIHQSADLARSLMPGDGILAQTGRALVTGAEDYSRFQVGATGGVLKVAPGTIEGLNALDQGAVHLATSSQARAEAGQFLSGVASKAGDYASDMITHPGSNLIGRGKLQQDEQALGKAIYDHNAGEVEKGHGPEAFGDLAGTIATFFIPGAGEASAASAGVRGVTTVARTADGLADLSRGADLLGDASRATRALPEAGAAATDAERGATTAAGGQAGRDADGVAGLGKPASGEGAIPQRGPVPGDEPVGPVHAPPPKVRLPEVTSEDIAALRRRIGVPERNTVGLARTNVPGLENQTFEGFSPMVRQEAGLPPAVRGPIVSPNPKPLFSNHAEEEIANTFVAAVDRAGLKPADLDGRQLTMRIQNPNGICTTCRQGLRNPDVLPGVLKQLSERYPGLDIRVIVDNPGLDLQSLPDFTLRGGRYVE